MLLRKDIVPGQIYQIVFLCKVLLWQHFLQKIVWWNCWSNFRGTICSNLAVFIYKILRIKLITLSSFRLSNLKSFTIPFLGGENKSSGTTKLPYWENSQKNKKNTFWPNSFVTCTGWQSRGWQSTGWDAVQFFFVRCSEHLQRWLHSKRVGWIRDLVCYLETHGRTWYNFSVFEKRPKDGT